MTVSPNRKNIPEVDHLRAFAALLVFFYHGFQIIGSQLVHGTNFNPAKDWVYPINPIVTVIEEGHTGVGLFIVLSGFILSLGSIGNTIDYKRFLLARILRIYPMLIVCLVIATCAVPSSVADFLKALLPLNVVTGLTSPFVGMFWAVAVEFQCYLIFPFLIAFSNKRGSAFLALLITSAIALRLLAVMADAANPRDLSYWTIAGRIDQFCIGIIAARVYVSKNLATLSPGWFLPAAIFATAIICLFNHLGGWPEVSNWKILWPTIEGLMWAFFIVSYLSAGRQLPNVLGNAAARLGKISYSLYLVHFPILFAIVNKQFYVRLTGNGYHDALVTTLTIALPSAILIATLTYHSIEEPFLELRPRYIDRNPETRSLSTVPPQ